MEVDDNVKKLQSLRISSSDEEDEAPNDGLEDELSDDDDDEEPVLMTLGFAEKPKNQWSLLPQYFPSKAGGTPAWLDPINLPSSKSSVCDFCGEPLQFLLQVYAPLSEESTFHRALFVFMCPSMPCLLHDQHEQWKRHPEIQKRSVKVFRCQLPRENSFYSREAPADDGTEKPLTARGTSLLCIWCGTWKGDKICSGCKRARYCSNKHQTAHWRSSKASHKVYCRQLETPGKASESVASNSLWPEYEITIEDECDHEDECDLDDDELVNLLESKTGIDEKCQKYFKGHKETRSWATFQAKIALAPEQVLRYSRFAQAKPLWPVSSGRPSKLDIPKCNHCNATRSFEFQVLPQLLYFFKVKDDSRESLDWATIVVYTCEDSCGGHVGYKEEFAWVQLPSQRELPTSPF